jgi:ADP-heptose:LPS heptosyltransferase
MPHQFMQNNSSIPTEPGNILLIKSHSMGIGDLLRSSAAWRVLKDRWPQAKLHLLMLSKHAGYASETFIRDHHLLTSATFITVKTGAPNQLQKRLPLTSILRAADQQLGSTVIDMVIDFEPYGIKTSALARHIARRKKAVSVGIAQFPLRRYFYDTAAPSVRHYTAQHRLNAPIDYTERDFVALAALQLERHGTRIELRVGAQGLAWQQQHAAKFDAATTHVVLNIGCGTLDALPRRPPLHSLVAAMVAVYQRGAFTLHLTGAPFEKDVNEEFVQLFIQALAALGRQPTTYNWAGQCTLNELTGLIAMADMMVSSDSGPYHMAVALGVPTLCWFNFDTPEARHLHSNVVAQTMPQPEVFADAAMQLLARNSA